MVADIDRVTREMFDLSLKREVFMKTPFLDELLKRNKVKVNGATVYTRNLDVAEMEDLAQDYVANEPLTSGVKDMTSQAMFTLKKNQVPSQYDIDEYLENITGTEETQLLDLAEFRTEKAQRASRLHLRNMMYGDAGDNGKQFQGFRSALSFGNVYGRLDRALDENEFWQPGAVDGDIANGAVNQAAARPISINAMRNWLLPLEQYLEDDSDLYIVTSPQIWEKLRQEAETRGSYKLVTTGVERQGFSSFEVDSMKITKDPYLGTTEAMRRWFFALNLNEWELKIHAQRNFVLTPYKWQGEVVNGMDMWLARVMLAGNLCCWKPNANMFLSNVR